MLMISVNLDPEKIFHTVQPLYNICVKSRETTCFIPVLYLTIFLVLSVRDSLFGSCTHRISVAN